MKKASMLDVAKEANVSVATVSHVINKDKAVSAKTRENVLNAIEKLNYSPNLVARGFKTGKRGIIGFIVPDIANPFFATLIEEVESIICKEGYQLIIANTKETKESEYQNIKVLSSSFVDGFIIASTLEDFNELKGALPDGFPAIFIDRSILNCPYKTICINSYNATKESIEYLINRGHKKIGYITGLLRISTSRERLQAYKDAMDKAGLDSSSYVRIGNSMSHCVEEHLSSLLDEGCTSLVIANNLMATEALIQLIESGVYSAKKLDIVGFKDSDQAQYGLQHMSLIVQPTSQLGWLAGMQILETIKNEQNKNGSNSVILQSTFVPKKSNSSNNSR